MSRICGILSPRNFEEKSVFLAGMLAAMDSEATRQILSDDWSPIALGWMGRSLGGAFFLPRPLCGQGEPEIAVVLDGCIYNRADVGVAASPAKGDAELVAKLYWQEGFEGALRRINGDFAVALYDFRDQSLWLGRDRLGLKPLYYHQGEDIFAFASRPRALLSLSGVCAAPNPKFVALFAASHYRYFDNDPEQSPYAGIAQLPAASILRLKDGQIRLCRYWELKELPDFSDSEEDLATRYRALLFDAVKIRLQRASRPAFTLSGGMDSSSVLISAAKLSGKRLPAFSTVYSDKTYDETNEIRSMLDAAVDVWHPVEIDHPDLFTIVEEMVRVHDEPVATATWLSHYLLCREVRERGFCALFGGLGGDELNAGEYEYYFFHFADLLFAGEEERLEKEVRLWIAYHDHPVYRKDFSVMQEGLRAMADLSVPGKCLPEPRRLRRYYAALNPDYYDLGGFVPVMEHPFKSYLKNRAYQDLTRETTPCCLRAEERQTTAFGLNNLLPFLDHRLVEFMFRVPGHYKIQNGITKHLLRQAMRDILPEETRTRVKKTGWNAPAHLWFALGGREQLLDLIHSRPFRERGIYHVREVERLVNEHYEIVTSGRNEENHMMFLWQLVNLELWFRCCLGKESHELS